MDEAKKRGDGDDAVPPLSGNSDDCIRSRIALVSALHFVHFHRRSWIWMSRRIAIAVCALLLGMLLRHPVSAQPGRRVDTTARAESVRSSAGPTARVPTRPVQPQASAEQADSSGVSPKLFEPGWVIFPTRAAVVTVLLIAAVTLVMGAVWVCYRIAHSLRHTSWATPPRRLKRGEIGAAGTSLALEWEDQLTTNREQDEERDRQIAALRKVVNKLASDHNDLVASVALLLEAKSRGTDEGESDDQGSIAGGGTPPPA